MVFVAGARVGDSVKIRITNVGSGYASGEIVKGDSIESLPPKTEAEAPDDGDK